MKRKIYGVHSEYNFGEWRHWIYEFDNKEDAQEWYKPEGCERVSGHLMIKTAAIKLVGKKHFAENMRIKHETKYGISYVFKSDVM